MFDSSKDDLGRTVRCSTIDTEGCVMSGNRWLYVDTYQVSQPTQGVPWSDSLGYGITSSSAIQRSLEQRGIEVVKPVVTVNGQDDSSNLRRVQWIADMYPAIQAALVHAKPDVVFLFHSFVTFPTVVRKMTQDIGRVVPIVGYTHGSHWDPTDLHRTELYPGLQLADLANLHVLDRLFVVSHYMKTVLTENIRTVNPSLAAEVEDRTRVVGLPVDVDLIDGYRTAAKFDRPTITFNHSPSTAKRPAVFFEAAAGVLRSHDVNILVTRRFSPESPGGARLKAITDRYPDRVILGDDMAIPDYYTALWKSDLQVSTASHESLGVATLEAMATGNCCVLPDIGAYSELVRGDADVLYDSSPAELTARLRHLLDHEEERLRIAGRLRSMTTPYETENVVSRILAEVSDLAPARHG
jgi:glycosyltransferase involved in cell wall biosynthesis